VTLSRAPHRQVQAHQSHAGESDERCLAFVANGLQPTQFPAANAGLLEATAGVLTFRRATGSSEVHD
jgi:hypothetical protein